MPQADIPRGIRAISWGTAVRWVGWGICEPILPLFLYHYLGSYGWAGFVNALGGIVFFLLLPLAGRWADRVPLRTFLLIGLYLFLVDATALYLTGVTGFVIFAVISQIFDGGAVVSDVVGRSTYVRKHAAAEGQSAMFGYMHARTNGGAIVGMLIAMLLLPRIPMHWAFLTLIPTTIATILIYRMALERDSRWAPSADDTPGWSSYVAAWKEIADVGPIRNLAVLTLVLSAVASIGSFLVPIRLFVEGGTIRQVILVDIVLTVPLVLSSVLGRFAGRRHRGLFAGGSTLVALSLLVLAHARSFVVILALVFAIRSVVVLVLLAVEGVVTRAVPSERHGRASALIEGMRDLGAFCGSAVFGFVADAAGVPLSIIAGALAAFLLGFLFLRKDDSRTAP